MLTHAERDAVVTCKSFSPTKNQNQGMQVLLTAI